MPTSKHACLIYVSVTESLRAVAREKLTSEGFEVCEVLADLDDAKAAQAAEGTLPTDLRKCIDKANVCVFLLPEDANNDGCIGPGGGLASELGKPFIAVVEGGREILPQVFDADAAGVVHDCEDEFIDAIRGDQTFKNPDGSNSDDRKITHIRCQ